MTDTLPAGKFGVWDGMSSSEIKYRILFYSIVGGAFVISPLRFSIVSVAFAVFLNAYFDIWWRWYKGSKL